MSKEQNTLAFAALIREIDQQIKPPVEPPVGGEEMSYVTSDNKKLHFGQPIGSAAITEIVQMSDLEEDVSSFKIGIVVGAPARGAKPFEGYNADVVIQIDTKLAGVPGVVNLEEIRRYDDPNATGMTLVEYNYNPSNWDDFLVAIHGVSLVRVVHWTVGPNRFVFQGSVNLLEVPKELPWSVTSCHTMFWQCYKFNSDITQWDTSNVTNMQEMFREAHVFNQEIGNWDTGNVTNMYEMFNEASEFNGYIGDWDTSNVTTMMRMFRGAYKFNSYINDWNVSNVTNMDGMFSSAHSFNSPLNAWDVSNVTAMSNMFYSTPAFNQDLSNWNVSSVKVMDGVFYNARAFNSNIGGWDVSSVTKMNNLFYGAIKFNQDLSNWDVSGFEFTPANFDVGAVSWVLPKPVWGGTQPYPEDADFIIQTDPAAGDVTIYNLQEKTRYTDPSDPSKQIIEYWYHPDNWKNFRVYVGGPGVLKVTKWSEGPSRIHFNHCTRLTTVPDWLPQSVNSTLEMFYRANKFNGNIGAWDTSRVTNMSKMFWEAYAFNQNLSGWDTSNVTDMSYMFEDASNFNGDISTWNVSNVTTMYNMFRRAVKFNSNISNWNVSKVTDMTAMFFANREFNCDLSQWDVSSVTRMSRMFISAAKFNGNIGGWDVSSVTDMDKMFDGAIAFASNLSQWNVGKVRFMTSMFRLASSFNSDLSGWCVSNFDREPAHFATDTTVYTLPRPIWGTCPNG